MQKTVVIADDSRLSRKIIRNVFEEIGYSVVAEAINGKEAVEYYFQYKPTLMTLDILMPELEGTEVIEKILPEDPQAKIIVISAMGVLEENVLEAGAIKFLQKPFLVSELIVEVEKLTGDTNE